MKHLNSRFTLFFFGLCVGIVLCLPVINYYEKTPKIVAFPVPEDYEHYMDQIDLILYNVPSKLDNGKRINWTIHLASRFIVQKENSRDGGTTEVFGFTNYDKHEIWSVYDPQVLLHELRHVLEGNFHR